MWSNDVYQGQELPANQDAVFLHGLSIATESETRDGMSNAGAVVQYTLG